MGDVFGPDDERPAWGDAALASTPRERGGPESCCPLCEGPIEASSRSEGAAVHWCHGCELGVTIPAPQVDYANYVDRARPLEQWLRYGREIVDFVVESSGLPASWLDFGAGGGELLLAAQERGVAVLEGVDLDRGSRELAAARGLEVHATLAGLGDRTFEVISASHVLEHVEDPVLTLTKLGAHLTDDGAVVVAQPDPSGLLPRLVPTRLWYGWALTEHRWHFTTKAMTVLFERAGLRVAARKRNSLDHPVRFDRALPLHLMGRLGAAMGRGDQFYLLGLRR